MLNQNTLKLVMQILKDQIDLLQKWVDEQEGDGNE